MLGMKNLKQRCRGRSRKRRTGRCAASVEADCASGERGDGKEPSRDRGSTAERRDQAESRIGLLFGEKAWSDGIGGVAAISADSRVVDGELGGEAGRGVACTGSRFPSPAGEGFRRAGLIY